MSISIQQDFRQESISFDSSAKHAAADTDRKSTRLYIFKNAYVYIHDWINWAVGHAKSTINADFNNYYYITG